MVNLSKHLHKDYWVRRITPDGGSFPTFAVGAANYKPVIIGGPGTAYMHLTQDMLMNEIAPSAHSINSKFMSKRAIYGPTGEKDKNGKEKWAIVGYDDVEVVNLGIQQMLAKKKASHFAADGFWMANETDKDEAFDILNSWSDTIGIRTAYMEAVNSCFQTGDAAIYLYQTGKEIDYEVFSYLKGDTLYPGVDENGNQTLYRQYFLNGKMAIDVFTTKYRETWVKVDDADADGQSWMERMKAFVRITKNEQSEDGFKLIMRQEAQTGSDLLQVIYFRVPDIPSGVAQQSIEKLESACSYIAEEVKGSAFPILFLKSEKIVNLPPSDINSKTIGVKGAADTVAHSDAKFLAPPDASNIATLNVNTLTNNILRSTMSVFVEPEILRAGADSSTTIKILFAPETQWCQNEWIHFAKPVKQLVNVLKTLVGKVEERVIEFSALKVSVGQNIWIPQNESERIKMELDQVYARTKSRKAAMEDIGNQHRDDFDQIEREWEKELEIKAAIPAEAKAKVEEKYQQLAPTPQLGSAGRKEDDHPNPNEPNIDNGLKGKTIAER